MTKLSFNLLIKAKELGLTSVFGKLNNMTPLATDIKSYLEYRNKQHPEGELNFLPSRQITNNTNLSWKVLEKNVDINNQERPFLRTIPTGKIGKTVPKYLVCVEDAKLFNYVFFDLWEQLKKTGVIKEYINPINGKKAWVRVAIGNGGKNVDLIKIKTKEFKDIVEFGMELFDLPKKET